MLGQKPANAIQFESLFVYTSEKTMYLSKIGKIHSNCDCIEGSVLNGVRQPSLYSFVLDKPLGYKIVYD